MTNRLLTLAVVGAVGAGSLATVATAHQGRGKGHVKYAKAQIATVTSYTSGTLTLQTANGTTVTGKVVRGTRFGCVPLVSGTTPTPTPVATTPTTPGDDYPTSRGGGRGGDDRGGDRGANRLHHDDEGDDDAVCDSSGLVAGAGVVAASTELSSTGQRFSRIVLVSTASNDADYGTY